LYSNTLSTGTYYQLLGAFPLKNLLKTDTETKYRQKIRLWHHHYFYNQSTNREFRAKNSYLCYNKNEKENISIILEIAGRGKAESSNSNDSEMLFSSMHHTLYFRRLQ
jgi:hypothetical protein